MDYWSTAPQTRDQLVLFSERLDDAIEKNHPVRLLDEVLGRLDWSVFTASYDGRRGQPPIHPRVLASAWLYGLMKRIRSSRGLEEALQVRLDFRWLVEGRTIDHTTLSEFRRKHEDSLKELFVQVGQLARHLNLLPLEELAYDGTRLRANNRRHGARTPAELQQWRAELSRLYDEQLKRLAAEDARENERLGNGPASELPSELANTERRLAQVDAALAELQRVKECGETVPSRIPLTDPQSRVTPNKEGGFAPNYTPLTTVDCQHGFIVACDVIAMTNEEHFLIPQIEQVQEDFQLPSAPPTMLSDGTMSTGANLQGLDEIGVTLYSPATLLTTEENPAMRADLTQPVAADQLDRLPTVTATRKGVKQTQFSKEAFVYDADQDCYWCPQGKPLARDRQMTRNLPTGPQTQTTYKASATACAECPLRAHCLQGNSQKRQVSRYEHDPLVEQLAKRMATPEGQAKYARRRSQAERPFAVIKQQFGARQFLLRGLQKVRIEWRWLVTAFNLTRLMSLWPSRAGP